MKLTALVQISRFRHGHKNHLQFFSRRHKTLFHSTRPCLNPNLLLDPPLGMAGYAPEEWQKRPKHWIKYHQAKMFLEYCIIVLIVVVEDSSLSNMTFLVSFFWCALRSHALETKAAYPLSAPCPIQIKTRLTVNQRRTPINNIVFSGISQSRC